MTIATTSISTAFIDYYDNDRNDGDDDNNVQRLNFGIEDYNNNASAICDNSSNNYDSATTTMITASPTTASTFCTDDYDINNDTDAAYFWMIPRHRRLRVPVFMVYF